MEVVAGRHGSVDLDEFLSRPLFAFLGTSAPEGPRVSPVWFLWEEGVMWIIADRRADSFPHRILADPRCALSIVDFDRRTGRVHHVGIRGAATVTGFDEQLARRLLRRYLGPDETAWDDGRFGPPAGGPDSVLVRVTPVTVVARDQSYRASSGVR